MPGPMRYWIEVTYGIRWDRLLRTKIVLDAPNTKRYRTFFAGVGRGDIVLHYLTAALTEQKHLKSSIVAISIVASAPQSVGNKIVADCSLTQTLPAPVKRARLATIKDKSSNFDLLMRQSMQKYLTEITRRDFVEVMRLDRANRGIAALPFIHSEGPDPPVRSSDS